LRLEEDDSEEELDIDIYSSLETIINSTIEFIKKK